MTMTMTKSLIIALALCAAASAMPTRPDQDNELQVAIPDYVPGDASVDVSGDASVDLSGGALVDASTSAGGRSPILARTGSAIQVGKKLAGVVLGAPTKAAAGVTGVTLSGSAKLAQSGADIAVNSAEKGLALSREIIDKTLDFTGDMSDLLLEGVDSVATTSGESVKVLGRVLSKGVGDGIAGNLIVRAADAAADTGVAAVRATTNVLSSASETAIPKVRSGLKAGTRYGDKVVAQAGKVSKGITGSLQRTGDALVAISGVDRNLPKDDSTSSGSSSPRSPRRGDRS